MAIPSYQQLLTGDYDNPYEVDNSITSSASGAAGIATNASNPFSFAGNLTGLGIGAYEFFKSQKQLSALDKIPYPNYAVSPELRNSYNQASSMSNQGFTASEAAGYKGMLSQDNALAYHRAITSAGGNEANVIQAGINSGNVNSANQFAIADAQLHRENMKYAGQLSGEIQGINNLQTQNNIQQRQYQEQTLAGESTAGLQSILNSLLLGGASGSKGYGGLLTGK